MLKGQESLASPLTKFKFAKMTKKFIDKLFSNKLQALSQEILQSKLFWFGLILKITFSALFASKFLSDFFLPFIDFYTKSQFENPYQYFASQGKLNSFPYPALMLWILSLPYLTLSPTSPLAAIFTLRIPILIADFVILLTLSRWLKYKLDKVIIFYWLSPVLIYINYIHGQLDVIPISILLASLYFLFKEKLILSSLLLGAAVACKTNILLAIPFFFIFLFSKKFDRKKTLTFATVLSATFLLINLPYLTSSGFISLVFLNKEQGKIFDLSYPFHQGVVFYFIPAAYFLLLVKALMIRGYNRDIFVMFLGFSFGVITLFTPPMQGWYYWVMPFLCYFYIKEKNAPNALFITLQLSYLLYFSLIKDSDFLQVFQFIAPQISTLPNLYEIISLKLNPEKITGIAFTILQASLFLNCIWIYRGGISSYLKHKLISQPYLIGISGDSGTGKTTLMKGLQQVFGQKNITAICGDDMHRWERGDQKWQTITHLNPSANRLQDEVSFLHALKNSRKISRKIYDHTCGKFSKSKEISAQRIVILEGLHSLYVEAVRKLFDLRIFIKPEKKLQTHWKIIRDQQKRRHSKEEVLEQIKRREGDCQKFILSQEKFADIRIELFSTHEIKNLGDAKEKLDLGIKLLFSNNINVELLLEKLVTIKTLKIEHNYQENDLQFIRISGTISSSEIKLCGDMLLEQSFEEINLQDPIWNNDLSGLIQLFLAFYIIQTEIIDERKNS